MTNVRRFVFTIFLPVSSSRFNKKFLLSSKNLMRHSALFRLEPFAKLSFTGLFDFYFIDSVQAEKVQCKFFVLVTNIQNYSPVYKVTELNSSVEPSSTQTLRTITSTDLRTDTKIQTTLTMNSVLYPPAALTSWATYPNIWGTIGLEPISTGVLTHCSCQYSYYTVIQL